MLRSRASRSLGLPPVLVLALTAASARAQSDDPYAYDVRLAVFPAFFQGGVSQSHFGSALRAELDLGRRLAVEASGRLPWANVIGEKDPRGYGVRAGLAWNFVDDEERQALSGTVYPEDTPKPSGGGRSGTDTDLDVPMSQKLGGPRLTLPEKDRSLRAPMRSVQSLRAGWELVRAVERGRPLETPESDHFVVNTLHVFHLGYGWGTYWNLSPASGGGERELGWRRFSVDLLFAPETLADTERLPPPPPGDPDFVPVGIRLAMAGAIDALARGIPGLGFAYGLELGALPGESGLEGYLFIGLGVELDATTRRRARTPIRNPNRTSAPSGAEPALPGTVQPQPPSNSPR